MKKISFLLYLILNLSLISFAQNKQSLSIKIDYTEASAKIEAFKGIEKKIDKNIIKQYLKDYNWKENIECLEGKVYYPENRYLCPFYLKKALISYSINYDDEENITLYYSPLGHLIKYEIITEKNYPRKIIGYSRFGNLMSIAFEINSNEQFIYNKNGKLLAHWKDDKIIDKKFLLFNLSRGSKD